MLNEKQVKNIERKLTDLATDYEDSRNQCFREHCRGYCQGIAFMLAKLGYDIEWDDGKATLVTFD